MATALTSLPHRYARALFELAQESKQLAAVCDDVAALRELLTPGSVLTEALDTQLNPHEAEALFNTIAKKMKLQTVTQRTLAVIARRRRADDLAEILTAFDNLRALTAGEVAVHVASATALTAAQRKEIEAYIKSENQDAKSVVLTEEVDGDLISGLVLQYGATQVDASAKGALRRLTLKLTH
jgi:F-type H+-transporting ATPase subunit delta